jgi:hypothetical protein
MEENKKKKEEKKDSTAQSLEDGKKAIGINKKLSDKPAEQKEKEESKDAKKWRNEG